MATAGWDNVITITAAGTMSREAYLTEYMNTFLKVSGSFFASIFENAGKSKVVTGVTKNATKTAKLRAKL